MEKTKSEVLDDGSLLISDIVIPVPETISKEAQLYLGKGAASPSATSSSLQGQPKTMEEMRALMNQLQAIGSKRMEQIYPIHIAKEYIGGLECDVVTPRSSFYNKSKIVLNVSAGGGYWGHENFMEAIPIANLLNTKVIKPRYKLMPEYSYTDSSLDILKLYKNVLGAYDPVNVGMIGASNGASLIFQTMVRILFEGHPPPGAIVAWSGTGDLSKTTDSAVLNQFFDKELRAGRMRNLDNESLKKISNARNVDKRDPFVSPIYASNLSDFPPSLLTSGTRDVSLSATTIMHRALLKANAHSELVIFEAMPHRFMFFGDLPEAKELYECSASFFGRTLGRRLAR